MDRHVQRKGNAVACHLMAGPGSEKWVPVIVRTPQRALTQTQMAQPTAHLAVRCSLVLLDNESIQPVTVPKYTRLSQAQEKMINPELLGVATLSVL